MCTGTHACSSSHSRALQRAINQYESLLRVYVSYRLAVTPYMVSRPSCTVKQTDGVKPSNRLSLRLLSSTAWCFMHHTHTIDSLPRYKKAARCGPQELRRLRDPAAETGLWRCPQPHQAPQRVASLDSPPIKVRAFGTSPLNVAPEKSKPGCCVVRGAWMQPRPPRSWCHRAVGAECAALHASPPHLALEALQHQALLVLLLRQGVQLVALDDGRPRLALQGCAARPPVPSTAQGAEVQGMVRRRRAAAMPRSHETRRDADAAGSPVGAW